MLKKRSVITSKILYSAEGIPGPRIYGLHWSPISTSKAREAFLGGGGQKCN